MSSQKPLVKSLYPPVLFSWLGITTALVYGFVHAQDLPQLQGGAELIETYWRLLASAIIILVSVYHLVMGLKIAFYEDKVLFPKVKYWALGKGECFVSSYEGIQALVVIKGPFPIRRYYIHFISDEGVYSDVDLRGFMLSRKVRNFLEDEFVKKANLTEVEEVSLEKRYLKKNAKVELYSIEQSKILGK